MRFFLGRFSIDDLFRVEFIAFAVCHVTLAVLIGLSFRRYENRTIACYFSGLVLLWWGLGLGTHFAQLWFAMFPNQYAITAVHLSVWGRIAAAVLPTLLYFILSGFHNGRAGLVSSAVAIAISAVMRLLWQEFHLRLSEDVVEIGDPLMICLAYWLGLTSWDVTAGWVTWYWFLFRKPAERHVQAAVQP